jgi:stage V sporulation protein K
MTQLNRLVGLESVKETVRAYMNSLEVSKRRGDRKTDMLQPYFVLLGRPGTGKTTVARILGRLFYDLGYLRTTKYIETGKAQLCGEYVSQAAVNTRNIFMKGLGGTIFIDEAYALVQPDAHGSINAYGIDSINTFLPIIENHLGELVVIIAGYADQMKAFLDANEGLRSRFTNFIHFPDYTPEECAQIFQNTLAAREPPFHLVAAAEKHLPFIFQRMRDAHPRLWANARDVRNLFQNAKMAMDQRLAADDKLDPFTMTTNDLYGGLNKVLQAKSI